MERQDVAVDWVIDFIKAEPEASTVIAALLAIVGGFLGSLASGWVQARGGRAQASAAVEAARITAEAQRIALLHTDRRKQIAEFVHEARQAVNTGNRLFSPIAHSEVAALEASVQASYSALTVKQAELELIAPVEVVERASDLVDVVENLLTLVGMRAAASREIGRLTAVRTADPGYGNTHRAYSALEALRAAYGEANTEQQRNEQRWEAEEYLRRMRSLDEDQMVMLLDDAQLPALPPLQESLLEDFRNAVRGLVISGRIVLRANDTQHE